MTAGRALIVTADDFGRTPEINAGVIAAHRDGIVTSASLMVRWPAAAAAVELAREHAGLSLGLHVDLGEWSWDEQDGWQPVYQAVDGEDGQAVSEEAARQLAAFRSLTGADPTHIDSHQHVHRSEPARSVLLAVAQKLGVPLRGDDARVHHCPAFYGQTAEGAPLPELITPEALMATIRSLPGGVSELGCHPGEGAGMPTAYDRERADELRALCDPRVRACLADEDVSLISFAELAREGAGA
jgi:chitin disaccharide deacetylase